MVEIISVYTREQAISDGVLIPFETYVRNEGGLFGPEFVEVDLEMIRIQDALFPLGDLIITPAAAERLQLVDAFGFLMRHQLGDWGEVVEEDQLANEKALKQGLRLFSVYSAHDRRVDGWKARFYVITEWNREATTVLIPEDY